MEELNEKGNLYPEFFPKTEKAKEYHDRHWIARSIKDLEQLNSLPVTVFLCGPSGSSDPLTRKKEDIVNELRKLGHDANTGEELVSELEGIDTGANRPTNIYENIAAVNSDMIIIICASPGSIGETHEFLIVPDIAKKTMVFIDSRFSDGYQKSGILEMHRRVHGVVETYDLSDVSACRLKGKVLEWVKDYQSVKWMARNNWFGEI